MAQKRRAAQVRVLHPDGAEKRLVDGADRDLRREIPLGVLRRPALAPAFGVGRFIAQLDLEAGQPSPFGLVDPKLAGHGEHHRRVVRVRKNAVPEAPDPLEDLRCRDPRRQGEVEPVDEALAKQVREAPQRGLRLARARFRFQHDEVGVRFRHLLLDRTGRPVPERVEKGRGTPHNDGAARRRIEADRLDGFKRPRPGERHPIGALAVGIGKEPFVRSEPVGQHQQAREGVMEGGRLRQVGALLEGLVEPSVERSTHRREIGDRIAAVLRRPMGVSIGRIVSIPGTAVVGKDGFE